MIISKPRRHFSPSTRPERQPGGTPRLIFAALGVALLVGCQSPGTSSLQLMPLVKVQNQAQDAQAFYQLGCYYMGQGRSDKALETFQKVLELKPDHAEAYNAIGALHGQNGLMEASINAFRKALALSPGAPHILNNLGYTLAAANRLPEAIETLQEATRRDPGNFRGWTNLALALRRAGRTAEADTALQRASTLQPPAPAPTQTPAEGTPPPVQMVELAAPRRPTRQAPPPGGLQAVAEAHNIIALKPAGAGTSRSGPNYRLTIVNGNGRTGVARQVRELLAHQGEPSNSRLGNLPPYTQRRTVVLYAPGFESDAMRVARQMGAATRLVSAAQVQPSDVRLVLGRDIMTAQSRPQVALDRLASAHTLAP